MLPELLIYKAFSSLSEWRESAYTGRMNEALAILALFVIPLAFGALLGFWPSRRSRRLRALNRLADRILNRADRVS